MYLLLKISAYCFIIMLYGLLFKELLMLLSILAMLIVKSYEILQWQLYPNCCSTIHIF